MFKLEATLIAGSVIALTVQATLLGPPTPLVFEHYFYTVVPLPLVFWPRVASFTWGEITYRSRQARIFFLPYSWSCL